MILPHILQFFNSSILQFFNSSILQSFLQVILSQGGAVVGRECGLGRAGKKCRGTRRGSVGRLFFCKALNIADSSRRFMLPFLVGSFTFFQTPTPVAGILIFLGDFSKCIFAGSNTCAFSKTAFFFKVKSCTPPALLVAL